MSKALSSILIRYNAGAASSDDDDDDDDEFTGGYVELLPTFYSLEKLKLGFVDCCSWNFLPFALERSPFLRRLDLEKVSLAFVLIVVGKVDISKHLHL